MTYSLSPVSKPAIRTQAEQILTIAENEQLLALANGNLGQQGEQVVGDTQRVFAHDSARVSAGWVEVPEESSIPLLHRCTLLLRLRPLSMNVVRNDRFDGGFGAAIDVGWANGTVLWDGNHVGETSGIAIDGCRGREDNVAHIVLAHRAEKCDASIDVDTVVFQRNLSGLANRLGL